MNNQPKYTLLDEEGGLQLNESDIDEMEPLEKVFLRFSKLVHERKKSFEEECDREQRGLTRGETMLAQNMIDNEGPLSIDDIIVEEVKDDDEDFGKTPKEKDQDMAQFYSSLRSTIVSKEKIRSGSVTTHHAHGPSDNPLFANIDSD